MSILERMDVAATIAELALDLELEVCDHLERGGGGPALRAAVSAAFRSGIAWLIDQVASGAPMSAEDAAQVMIDITEFLPVDLAARPHLWDLVQERLHHTEDAIVNFLDSSPGQL